MNVRKEQVKELVDGFQSFSRNMAFRPGIIRHAPRITPSQWGVLMMIEGRSGITVKDIAKTLNITSSAATQLIDGLVTSGYVGREEHAEDRRKVTLSLSSKTKRQVEKMKNESIEQFLKFFEVFSDREFRQFVSLHQKLFERHQISKETI